MSWLVPSPASLKLTVRDPSEFTVALALMKCGLTARAAGAAITSPARNTGRAKMNSRRRRMLDHSPWGLRDLYTLSRQEGRLSLTSRAGGYGHHEVGAS